MSNYEASMRSQKRGASSKPYVSVQNSSLSLNDMITGYYRPMLKTNRSATFFLEIGEKEGGLQDEC